MTNPDPSNPGRWTAFRDLSLIIFTLLTSKYLLLQVDAIWTLAGPISLLLALGVATICLRRNGQSWSSVGLKRPENMKRLALWTVVALVVTIGVGIVAESFIVGLFDAPDQATQAIDARYQGRFDNLQGNFPVFLFWLMLAWVIGGFTEEMLFRGALFSRFEHLFTGIPFSAFLAIVCQAILFGQAHFYYQGVAGWLATGAIAIASGLLYLAFKRNLWPLMLSHGLSNTIGLTLLYLGVM